MISKYGRVAVAELVFYCPLLFVNLWVAKRRNFDRRSAWVYLNILAIIRIIGASIQLQSEQTPRKPLITVAAIASSVGIAPLELFMSWHLKRINSSIEGQKNASKHIFTAIYGLVIVAVVLAIAGGATASYSAVTPFHAKTLSKIAIVILIAVFLAMLVANIFLLFSLRYIATGEKWPLLAVTAGSPFLGSRLVYSCISAYYASSTFNPVAGNVWVLSFMSVFEELTTVVLYTLASIKTPQAKEVSRQSSISRESAFCDAETGLPNEETSSGDGSGTIREPDVVGGASDNSGRIEGVPEQVEGEKKDRSAAHEVVDCGQSPIGRDSTGIEMQMLAQGASMSESDQNGLSRKASLMDSMINVNARDTSCSADSKASTVVDRGE